MTFNGNEIAVKGKFARIAQFSEEWDVDVESPEAVIQELKERNSGVDIFTFMQRLPESKPRFAYHLEWESVAALPITTYDLWLKKQVAQNSRKKIGYAKRKGVEVEVRELSDDLVRGILEIYRETPVRQGKKNRAYNVTFEEAKRANEPYLDRAVFLGAYYENELIGFLKIVDAGKFTRTMGILGKTAHKDKGVMNLLVAKAVEICVGKGTPFLTYGNYDFGKVGRDTFKDFKQHMGFENIILPRYYIPLSLRGRIILKLGLHRGFVQVLPKFLVRWLIAARQKWYEMKYPDTKQEKQTREVN